MSQVTYFTAGQQQTSDSNPLILINQQLQQPALADTFTLVNAVTPDTDQHAVSWSNVYFTTATAVDLKGFAQAWQQLTNQTTDMTIINCGHHGRSYSYMVLISLSQPVSANIAGSAVAQKMQQIINQIATQLHLAAVKYGKTVANLDLHIDKSLLPSHVNFVTTVRGNHVNSFAYHCGRRTSGNTLAERLHDYLATNGMTLGYGDSLMRLVYALKRATQRKIVSPDQCQRIRADIQQQCQACGLNVDINAMYTQCDTTVSHPDYPTIDQFYVIDTSCQQQSLGEWLLALLGDDFVVSEKNTLADVVAALERTFSWGVRANVTDATKNLLMFDPRQGMWVHDPNLLRTLINTLRPLSTRNDDQAVIDTIATNAINAQRYVSAYHGSRFLLFDNGVLDVKTKQLLPLSSDYVRALNFTSRNRLHHRWAGWDVPLPTLPHRRQIDNGDWNPQDFIDAYVDNDPQLRQYLLFGLSLGLFSGHNFHVVFDIQGPSRWGKSTLFEIYRNVFDHTLLTSFSTLNGRFPFTNYDEDTAVIWLNECNPGANTLSAQYGTQTFDALCDNICRFQSKGTGDIVLQNPPQVYVDGVSLIHADDMRSGPAGRTLPFIIADDVDIVPENNPRYRQLPDGSMKAMTLREQAYSNDISNALQDERVIDWLLAQMLSAYRAVVSADLIDDLTINPTVSRNGLQLPKTVESWRNEFVRGGNALNDWFVDSIVPLINSDPYAQDDELTVLHDSMLYRLYDENYHETHPVTTGYNGPKSDELSEANFVRMIHECFDNNGYTLKPFGKRYTRPLKRHGKIVYNADGTPKYVPKYNSPRSQFNDINAARLNIDPDALKELYIPNDFIRQKATTVGYPFGKTQPGWYTVRANAAYADDALESDD